MGNLNFVLASASPARLRLLENAGIKPIVCVSDFDESQIKVTDPGELVQILAKCKAKTVADTLEKNNLVLGCDSVLMLKGEIHGKPMDAEDAIARWQKMRGEVGQLYTGHALIDLWQNQILVRCQITQVYFANVSDREIINYVATGEPLKCAGCFALEGKGGLFVEKLDGCHSNVIGLSMPLLRQMLNDLGYTVMDFWR